jgi:general secretion pathway protein K
VKRRIPPGERGAALLAVLLLVAIMGALAAAALERLRLSTSLAINSAALDQARSFAVGVESLLTLGIDDLVALSPERTTLVGGWNGQTRRIPMPGGGVAEATIRDGGNCFNINSVAEGTLPTALTPRAAGVMQFASLMRVLEVPETNARQVAEAAGDWVDTDLNPSREGAEDQDYLGAEQGYRTGNTLFADVSELRAVSGMTPQIYERIRSWLCALPTTDLSPINVNTLAPEQAPLLAMLAPEQVTVDRMRRVLAERPTAGWSSTADFFRSPGMVDVQLPLDVRFQPQLRTRWFKLDLRVELQGAELSESALVDARIAPSRVAARRWGDED